MLKLPEDSPELPKVAALCMAVVAAAARANKLGFDAQAKSLLTIVDEIAVVMPGNAAEDTRKQTASMRRDIDKKKASLN